MAIDVKAIALIDRWWHVITKFADDEANPSLPANFYNAQRAVMDVVRAHGADAGPFFEVGELAMRHVGMIGAGVFGARDPYATIGDLVNAIWRAIPAKDALLEELRRGPIGESKGIPPEHRTKAISKGLAAKLLGRPNPDSGVKWLNACIADGTISCESMSPKSHIFDLRQFSKETHDRLRPKK